MPRAAPQRASLAAEVLRTGTARMQQGQKEVLSRKALCLQVRKFLLRAPAGPLQGAPERQKPWVPATDCREPPHCTKHPQPAQSLCSSQHVASPLRCLGAIPCICTLGPPPSPPFPLHAF